MTNGGAQAAVNVSININSNTAGARNAANAIDQVKGKTDATAQSVNNLTRAEQQRKIALDHQIASMGKYQNVATMNLGVNLGMLFGVMSLTGAYMNLSNILTEVTGKNSKFAQTMKVVNKVIMFGSSILSTSITLMMLKQAAVSRVEQANRNALAAEANLLAVKKVSSAADIQAAAAAYANATATNVSTSANKKNVVSWIARHSAASLGIMGAVALAAVALAVGGAIALMGKFQFGTTRQVNRPQLALVGESGTETMTVDPSGGGGGGMGGGGDTFIFNEPIYGVDHLERAVTDVVARARGMG